MMSSYKKARRLITRRAARGSNVELACWRPFGWSSGRLSACGRQDADMFSISIMHAWLLS